MNNPYRICLSLFCTLFTVITFAQNGSDWEKQPKLHDVPDSYRKESAVFILDRRYVEYVSADKEIMVMRTIHRIIKVYDDKGIESFNKISLPSNSDKFISDLRARVILPGGKIIESGKDKIKESKNEDGKPEYFLAIDGVEKNAEVEILYTEKRSFSISGSESMQYSIPVMKAVFTLVVPDRFMFELKGYNGFSNATDTSYDEKNIYTAVTEKIPAIEDETYSNTSANEMRIDYRLSYLPKENPGVRLFTWNDLAKQQYESYYNISDKDRKIIQRYLKELGVQDDQTEEQKIRKIEDGLKTNINMSTAIDEEAYSRFDVILDKKLTTEDNFVKLFLACLTEAGVQHEIGFTSNKYNYPFDEKFENWKLMDQYVIYFPKLKKYTCPSAIFFRMPFVPLPIAGNKAVFCKVTTLGNMTSAIAQVKTIPMLPGENTHHNMDADISFSTDMTANMHIVYSFKGYAAAGLREAFIYVPQDKQKELVENLLDGIMAQPEELKSYKVENKAFENYYDNTPLLVSADVQSAKLIEKAGPKYLFKVGDVIGRQAQMYQEKERTQPIDIDYPHSLVRTITLTVPAGYKIANPDAVKLFAEHKNAEGKQTMGFISDYKIEGNKMHINIREFYDQMHYPISDIEVFKSVINAAADFNKVILVLEKA